MTFFPKFLIKINILLILMLANIGYLSSEPNFWEIFDDSEFFGLKTSPYSNVVKTSIIDDKGNIYVGLWANGVFKSTDKGSTWQQKNSGLSNRNITDITFTKSGNILVTTFGGGVFQSVNKGDSWISSSTGINHLNMKTLIKHPNGWLFAGTMGGGVYMSKDDGYNWTQTAKGLNYRNVSSLSYTNNGFVVAGTYGGGVYVTRDTGRTWIVQNTGLKSLYINDLVRSADGAILAATNGKGIFESGNDGLSWAQLDTFMIRPYTNIHTPLPDMNVTNITLNKNSKTVFGTRYGGIFLYDDVEDFTWVSSNVRGVGVNNLITDKSGEMYGYVNEKQPQVTFTTGETWDDKPIMDEAKNPKLFILGRKHLLLYDNGGNFIVSNDDGENWTTVATLGFPLNAVCRDSSGNLFAASERGLYFSNGDGTSWSLIRFKDTIVHDVEVAPNGYVWVTTTFAPEPPPGGEPSIYRNVYNSSDGGFNWNDVTMDLSKYNQTPQKLAINSNNHVYCALNNIFFYSNDNGSSWRNSNKLGTDANNIQDVAIDKNGVIYAATYYGLYRSQDVKTFVTVPLFMTYNNLVHVDRNGVIYGTGQYYMPNNFASFNLSYRSLDTGQTFTVLNNSYNSDNISSIASDPDGDVYFTTTSGLILKSIYQPTLSTPKLLNIADKSVDVPNNPILNWEAVEKAELYQLQVSIDEDFIFNFENITLSDIQYQLNEAFFPNTKFYFRVRAKNNAALSDWSETRSFISKIATPILVSPDSNAVGVRVYADLNWHPVPSATQYEIIVSKYTNFKDTIYYNSNATDTNVTTAILEGLTKYHWKVRAMNDKSTSLWSNTWNFTTVLGPPKLKLPIDKQNGLDRSVNFVWYKAIQAVSYKLLISDKADFTGAIQEFSVTDTLFTVPGFSYDTWGWWKVASINSDGESEFSEVFSFRIGYSPVVLALPENTKGNVKIPVDLKWNEHETQNLYELQVSENNEFTLNVKKYENIDNVTQQTITDLKYFTDYFWKVRVVSTENIGNWSESFTFRTILGKVGLRSPANLSKGLPPNISFLWFALQGAVKYHLQISRDEKFENLVFSQDTLSNFNMLVNELPNNVLMYWRVRGVSNDGYGEWSDVWNFTTAGNAPVLISPSNGLTNVKIPLKFSWDPFNNAINYKFQLSNNETFDNIIAGANDIAINQYNITTYILEPSTSYYWHVQANLNGAESNWSQTWSFTTDPVISVNDIAEIAPELSVVPNPVNESTQINFKLSNPSNTTITILDMAGRIVFKKDLGYLTAGNNYFVWQPEILSNGKYFIQINYNSHQINGELILNR